jgi:hypothetical protein
MLRFLLCATLAVLSLIAIPRATCQCIQAICSLTIDLQSDAAGIALGGSGGATTTMAFGAMQAFGGTVPTGVTKIVGASTWTVTTPFDVKVTCFNLITLIPCTLLVSPGYTLTAQLQSSDTINTWKIGSFTLSSTTATTLTTSGTYNSVTSYTFGLTIPFTEVAGVISNTVSVVAIAN